MQESTLSTRDRAPASFVIVAPTRSGSTWLMDRIDKLPGMEGHMELFNSLPRQRPPKAGTNDYPRFVEIGRQFGTTRPRAVFRYLDELYARPAAVGFKLMYPHLRDYPELLLYLMRRSLSVVHLVRDNHLDVVISEQLIERTGRRHLTRDEKSGDNVSIQMNAAHVAARVRWLDRKTRIVRRLLRMQSNPVHEVCYEDLCRDDRAFQLTCEFLQVPAEHRACAESNLVKTQRAAHVDVIENYQEVRSALETAGYRHLLQ